MEKQMGISMRINMPSSAAKAPLALGAFIPKTPGSVVDAVSSTNPDAKFSFKTTLPFVAPTMDMPTLTGSKPSSVRLETPFVPVRNNLEALYFPAALVKPGELPKLPTEQTDIEVPSTTPDSQIGVVRAELQRLEQARKEKTDSDDEKDTPPTNEAFLQVG